MSRFINLIKQTYKNLTEINVRYKHRERTFYARKISFVNEHISRKINFSL